MKLTERVLMRAIENYAEIANKASQQREKGIL